MEELYGEDDVVMPGDVVGRLQADEKKQIRIGGGLRQQDDKVVAYKAGKLHSKHHQRYWVEGSQKRYNPVLEDSVVGVITDRHAEGWKVDIGAAQLASLPALAFEGATKRNRPPLLINSLVYARVVVAHKDMEPELACVSAGNKADGFGELKDGYVFECSLGLAKSLLSGKNPVLSALGKAVPFEMAVGANGKVWVTAGSAAQTVIVANAISNSEFIAPEKIPALIQGLIARASDD